MRNVKLSDPQLRAGLIAELHATLRRGDRNRATALHVHVLAGGVVTNIPKIARLIMVGSRCTMIVMHRVGMEAVPFMRMVVESGLDGRIAAEAASRKGHGDHENAQEMAGRLAHGFEQSRNRQVGQVNSRPRRTLGWGPTFAARASEC